jgi:hypothetical protein
VSEEINRTDLGPDWGALPGVNFFLWQSSRANGSWPDILVLI